MCALDGAWQVKLVHRRLKFPIYSEILESLPIGNKLKSILDYHCALVTGDTETLLRSSVSVCILCVVDRISILDSCIPYSVPYVGSKNRVSNEQRRESTTRFHGFIFEDAKA